MAEKYVAPEFEVRLYEYFQEEKIEHLYNQIVERSEISLTRNQGNEKNKGVKAEGGLGELLTKLGLKASLSGEIQAKNSTSESAEYKLTAEQKLRVIWEYFRSQGKAGNLNALLKLHKKTLSSFTLFFFQGENAQFSLEDPNKEILDLNTLVRIQCQIEKYQAEFFCSMGHFGGSALMLDINEKVTRDISGICSIKDVDHERKHIFLNPIAF